MNIGRRDFMTLVLGAMGGGIQTRALANMLTERMKKSGTQPDALMINRAPYTEKAVSHFTPSQRACVAAITDTIIPRTDTPGAVDAGVPHFIELVFAEWMHEEERTRFLEGLSILEGPDGSGFAMLGPEERIATLESMEKEATHPWFELGGPAAYEGDVPFIVQVKELTVTGFFMSETGATEVLRHNHFPGYFEGDIALEQHESTWTPTPLV